MKTLIAVLLVALSSVCWGQLHTQDSGPFDGTPLPESGSGYQVPETTYYTIKQYDNYQDLYQQGGQPIRKCGDRTLAPNQWCLIQHGPPISALPKECTETKGTAIVYCGDPPGSLTGEPTANLVAKPVAPTGVKIVAMDGKPLETMTATAMLTPSPSVLLTCQPPTTRIPTSYSFRRSTVKGGPYTEVGQAPTCSFTDVTVNYDNTYYYVAFGLSGTLVSKTSSNEAIAVVGSDPSPLPPTGLTATPQTAGNVLLKWKAPPEPIIAFGIERQPPGSQNFIGLAHTINTSYTDKVPRAGTYRYQVRAMTSKGRIITKPSNIVTVAVK